MNKRTVWLAAMALTVSVSAYAGDAKTYQVTGPVVEITGDTITVQKGKDNWEIGKNAATKVSADFKKGDKVTVMYRMTATSIDVKTAAKPSKKK